MPTFDAAVKLQKIPVQGLVPESSAGAPATPANGQLWNDTSGANPVVRYWDGAAWQRMDQIGTEKTANKGAANGYASLDGTTKVPIGQLPTGNTALTVAIGNDARLSDQRVPIDASVTGGPAGAGVKLAAGTVTHDNIAAGTIRDTEIAAANKDGVAGTASLRTLGNGAQQAMAGSTTLDLIPAPTASRDMNAQRIVNMGAPVNPNDAARLQDVQNAAAGIDVKPSVRLATAAALPANTAAGNTLTGNANGALSVDGVAVAVNDRVLVKNEATGANNGLFSVTATGGAGAAFVLTRTSDNINPNTFVFVEEGTAQHDTGWMVTNDGAIVVGTTALTWTQFGAATSYTGTANRITVAGGTIDIASTYVGQATITTLGVVGTGTWQGTAVSIGFGGTGAGDAPTARTNLNVPQRGFAVTMGALAAGVASNVNHNLNTLDVVVQCYLTADGTQIELDVTRSTVNQVQVKSDVAFGANAVRVVCEPIQ